MIQQTQIKSISEILDIAKGKKVKIISHKTKNSVPYLLIDTLRGKDPEFFTEDKKYTKAVESDILMVFDGANSGLVGSGLKGAVGSTIARLRPKKDVNPKYLTYFLGFNFSSLNQDMKGSAIPHIKPKKLLGLNLRYPSKEEQEAIVSEIEKQLTRLETAVKALKSVKDKLEIYRKAIINSAFEGKLIKEEFNNSAKQIISKTKKERREFWEEKQLKKFIDRKIKPKNNWKKDYIEPKELDYSNLKYIKNNWVWTTFENICDFDDNSIKAGPFGSSLKKEFYVDKGYKIYGQEQVIRNDAYYGDYYISEEKFNSLKSCEVKPYDLLISLVGTIGKILILPKDCEKGIINPRLVKISLYQKIVNPRYIKYYLTSPFAIQWLKKDSHGQTMNILNLTILKKLPISLAPIDEQNSIVEEIEARFSVIDKIEQVVEQSLLKAEKLRKSVLKSAFEGKLVKEIIS